MAGELARMSGATKRQVQLWTDAGALRCVAGTDRQGRGRQRLYSEDEARYARLAAYCGPVGRVVQIVAMARDVGWPRSGFFVVQDDELTVCASAEEAVAAVVRSALIVRLEDLH